MPRAQRVTIEARQTPIPQTVELYQEAGLGPLSAVAIALSSRLVAWRLEVFAALAPGRWWRVGTLIVPAPISLGVGARLVALATIPGAMGWRVDAKPEGAPADPTETGEVEIAAADVGAVGLTPLGFVELVGARRHYIGATLPVGATNIIVPATRRIRRVAAWQDGTGTTVSIAGGNPVPLPPLGAISLEVDLFGTGATAVAFAAVPAGGGGYLVEFEE